MCTQSRYSSHLAASHTPASETHLWLLLTDHPHSRPLGRKHVQAVQQVCNVVMPPGHHNILWTLPDGLGPVGNACHRCWLQLVCLKGCGWALRGLLDRPEEACRCRCRLWAQAGAEVGAGSKADRSVLAGLGVLLLNCLFSRSTEQSLVIKIFDHLVSTASCSSSCWANWRSPQSRGPGRQVCINFTSGGRFAVHLTERSGAGGSTAEIPPCWSMLQMVGLPRCCPCSHDDYLKQSSRYADVGDGKPSI